MINFFPSQLTTCDLRFYFEKGDEKCPEEMEPALPGEPVVEREEVWAGAREPALEPEGWVERGPAQGREENACARNAGRPFLTGPEHPAFR